MKKYPITIILILISICHSLAQSDSLCHCCSENHKAFDFWMGDWTVYSTTGEIIGTNEVLKLQEGCVLQENWKASNQVNTGTSYNYFDSSDNTWNQVWISSTGNILKLTGNINKDGEMVLKSKLVNGPKGNYFNQITWTKSVNGSVIQRWEILDENSVSLSKAFEGIYKK